MNPLQAGELPLGVELSLALGYCVVPWVAAVVISMTRGWRHGCAVGYLVLILFSLVFETVLPASCHADSSVALAWCDGSRTAAALLIGVFPAMLASFLGRVIGFVLNVGRVRQDFANWRRGLAGRI